LKVAVTILVFCVAALLALGLVMLYSSGMYSSGPMQLGARYLMMQLVWCAAGLVLCVVAALLDYRWLRKVAWPLFAFSVALLALVLVPHLAAKTHGARRWFNFHGMSFQPSELAKLALIVALAWYGEHYQRQMPKWKRGIFVPVLFVGVVLGLVFVEPDRGTTILLAAVSGTMLLIAGVRWKFILPPVVAGAGALVVSVCLDPMRIKRVLSWVYLEENKSGVGYQAYQAMLALGAGGWSGLGLGSGRQKLGGFVPEHHTDFIFSIIGEELGLVATLLVIIAFVAIVVCGVYVALQAPDTFGFLLGAGITFLIGFQAFINVGVVTSALPNKGLPLPFISYGGSNLLIMLTGIGLLLSIARQARTPQTVGASSNAGEDGFIARRERNPFQKSRTEIRRSKEILRNFEEEWA
jgi:cell division protein FtsW